MRAWAASGQSAFQEIERWIDKRWNRSCWPASRTLAVSAAVASRRSLASRGRVISQALSFKLLAIVALVLVAMALVPLTVRKGSRLPIRYQRLRRLPRPRPPLRPLLPYPRLQSLRRRRLWPRYRLCPNGPIRPIPPPRQWPPTKGRARAPISPWQSVRPNISGTIMTALDQAFIKAFSQPDTFPLAVAPCAAAPANDERGTETKNEGRALQCPVARGMVRSRG